MRRLQVVQNRAARLALGCDRDAHVDTMLKTVGWLTVRDRIQHRSLVIFKRIMLTKQPNALYDKITFQSEIHKDAPGTSLDPARDLTAARPKCKSRSAPYRKPHGSRRETDRAPDGSLTETGRQGHQNRRTLGVMTPAGVYTEDMPNGRRFKCDLSITSERLYGL
ncbi:hypothetical protein Bbelb_361320 [Branchiostoma belcheri]|nr:hypothetical protein Bbelb_361320 [Branchiostoma belcheri]